MKRSDDPRSIIVEPVFDSFDEQSRSVVGVVVAVETWTTYFESQSRPEQVHGFILDIVDTCGGEMIFVLNGQFAEYKGNHDIHNKKYDYLARRSTFAVSTGRKDQHEHKEDEVDVQYCDFSLTVYPTTEFESDFHTAKPLLFAAVMVAVFVTACSVFAIYDWMVKRRQEKMLVATKRTTAIAHSLFPKSVGERLIAASEEPEKNTFGRNMNLKQANMMENIAVGLNNPEHALEPKHAEPIADFFTSTTIMFADIVGFTAWSSTREPKQVFTLLETIYQDFDSM